MLRGDRHTSGWQGACLVAITYVYFLIFAQFAFLRRLASLGVTGAHLTAVMAAMAIGGIFVSLAAPRLSLWPSPNLRLRCVSWEPASLFGQRRWLKKKRRFSPSLPSHFSAC